MIVLFFPLEPEKWPKPQEKKRINSCDDTKIRMSQWNIFRLDRFSSVEEAAIFTGLVARRCLFDVTACAEARRLEKFSK